MAAGGGNFVESCLDGFVPLSRVQSPSFVRTRPYFARAALCAMSPAVARRMGANAGKRLVVDGAADAGQCAAAFIEAVCGAIAWEFAGGSVPCHFF